MLMLVLGTHGPKDEIQSEQAQLEPAFSHRGKVDPWQAGRCSRSQQQDERLGCRRAENHEAGMGLHLSCSALCDNSEMAGTMAPDMDWLLCVRSRKWGVIEPPSPVLGDAHVRRLLALT